MCSCCHRLKRDSNWEGRSRIKDHAHKALIPIWQIILLQCKHIITTIYYDLIYRCMLHIHLRSDIFRVLVRVHRWYAVGYSYYEVSDLLSSQILFRVVWMWHEFDTSIPNQSPVSLPLEASLIVQELFACIRAWKLVEFYKYDQSWFPILVLQQRCHMYKCMSFSNLGQFGWISKWCLIFIQVSPLIFLPCKVKAFLSLTKFFPFSCLSLGVRVVVWVCC